MSSATFHLVTDRAGLAPHLSEGPTRVRVYAGYTGWGPDQLESEMTEGAWHVLPATPKFAFDDDPETLWTRLSHSAEMQLARLFGCGYTHELVPHAVDRDQVLGLALLEFCANPGDVIVDRAGGGKRVVAPYFVEQLVPC